MTLQRVYITGAPGGGVTTLGRALATRLRAPLFDIDDYYWMPTDPPYLVKREIADRIALLASETRNRGKWVISGSLDGWGQADRECRFDGLCRYPDSGPA